MALSDYAEDEGVKQRLQTLVNNAVADEQFAELQREDLTFDDDPSAVDAVWDNEEIERPTVCTFADDPDRALFYEGRFNVIFGNRSAGKSFLTAYAETSYLNDGRHVLHIETDNNTRKQVLKRLKAVGASREMVKEFWHFYSLASLAMPPTPGWVPELVVIDALNPALSLLGMDYNTSGRAMDLLMKKLVNPLTDNGATVVAIDHTNDPRVNQFGQEIEAVRPSNNSRKLQAVQGIALQLMREIPSNVGSMGMSVLVNRKDNPGGCAVSEDEELGRVLFDGTKGDGSCVVTLQTAPLAQLAETPEKAVAACKKWLDKWREMFAGEWVSVTKLIDSKVVTKATFYRYRKVLLSEKEIEQSGDKYKIT